MFPDMNQAPKQLTDWAAYVEDVRREAREQGRAEGRAEGFEQGYQKAVADASAAAVAAVAGIAEIIKTRVAEIGHHQGRQAKREEQPYAVVWSGDETNRQKVLIALEHQPGMRPIEIIQWLIEYGANPNANSILTTIKRMRGTDIEKRGDGWYIRKQVESAA